MPIQSINPATGEIIATYEHHNAAHVEAALGKASGAFQRWRGKSFEERADVLRALAAAFRAGSPRLAELITLEMGKPIKQAGEECEKSARALEYYADNAAHFAADESVQTDALKSYVHWEPAGPVLAVMPWNFPVWQAMRAAAAVLAGGNVMLLKHASNVSGCALAIEEVFRTAGVPDGLFQTLMLPASEVAPLIAHPAIRAVTFTGSTAAGRQVAAAAGSALKKCVLELGGSDPYIILEDADLNLAVDVCAKARLVNSGQSCVAAKRFVVVRPVLEEFTRRFTRRMEEARFGSGMDAQSAIGPLARTDLRDDLHAQVQSSIAKGARLLCGGFIPEMSGAFYPPTVLAGVRPGMPAYDEETFGPVAAIIEAQDEAEAMRIANDSVYGLGGAIFSRDRNRAESLAARGLEAGSCFVNAAVHSDPRLPFGGVKDSGLGRELGAYGMREFMIAKTVFVQ